MAKPEKSPAVSQKPCDNAYLRTSQNFDFVNFPAPRKQRKLATSLVLAVVVVLLLFAGASYFAVENQGIALRPPRLVPPAPAQNIGVPDPFAR